MIEIKIKKILQRCAALISAVTMGLTGLTGVLPAAAETSGVTLDYVWNSNINPTLKNNKYASSNAVSSDLHLDAGEQICRFLPSTSTDDTDLAFCIEPGATLLRTDKLNEYDLLDLTEENKAKSYEYYAEILKTEKLLDYLGLVQYYGYSSHKTGNYYAATQILLWELVLGYRGHTEDTFTTCSDVLYNDFTYPSGSGSWCTSDGVKSAYNAIVSKVSKHYDIPSAFEQFKSDSIDNPYRMKYNTSNMRYEVSIKIATSYITASSLEHNFSTFESVLKKLLTSNFSGTYGTDYGYTKSESGTNTVFTVWSKKRQLTTSVITSEAIQMQIKSGLTERESLFASSNYQTCLLSTRIDPVSGYVSVSGYNEPNLTVNKTYYDENGTQLTGANLTAALGSTQFVISSNLGGSTTYYVKATYDSSSEIYIFSEYVSDISDATKFETKSVSNNIGTFTVNDLPTSTSNGRTYKVSEYNVPTGYEKLRICFDYLGQSFELDLYSFSDKYATLEIELDDINRTVTLPDCLNVVEDVTGDKQFSNFALSLNQNFEI